MIINQLQFEEKYDLLNVKIKSHYKKVEKANWKFIEDGIINVKKYFDSHIKIMWILKEPYCDNDNSGGGWSLVRNLDIERSEGKKKDSSGTWHPIAYCSYGILNGFLRFEKMGEIKNSPEINKSIKNIAFINIQKLPAKRSSNDLKIGKSFSENQDILIEQISIINPDIIICGAGNNAFGRLKKHLNKIKDSEKKCLIHAYHPNQKKIGRDKYVNQIILEAEEWYNKN